MLQFDLHVFSDRSLDAFILLDVFFKDTFMILKPK